MTIESDRARTPESSWLEAGLDGLRRQLPKLGAPASVERNLLAQMRASHALRARVPWWRLIMQQFFIPALALGGALVFSLPLLLHMSTPSELDTQAAWTAPSMKPFYALAKGAAAASDGEGIVVPTELSSQTLQDFGLPVDPARAGRPVSADVLIGAGGEIIGVRLSRDEEETR